MINRSINPKGNLILKTSSIDTNKLLPSYYTMDNGKNIVVFKSDSIDIVKIDFVFEAGKAYQTKKLTSLFVNKLITEGTSKHTAKQIAEILDYRGVYIEKYNDSTISSISVLMIKKYAEEILPLLYEIFTEATFPDNEFEVALKKYKQNYLNDMMKPQYLARKKFYESIYGRNHVYGSFASEVDFDLLTIEDVRNFHNKNYKLNNCTIFASGNIDKNILAIINQLFGKPIREQSFTPIIPQPIFTQPEKIYVPKQDAVQSAIRIGKVLNTTWDTTDFTDLMIANTILGGYFGSKLTTKIREEKGYCYSIYSMVQAIRGTCVFFITTEVGKEVKDNAIEDIYNELQDICSTPISTEELEVVKNYLIGDFIRSIDGVFEISERHKQMVTNHSTELFTDNYLKSIDNITPTKIYEISNIYLNKDSMTQIIVG